MLVNYVLEKIKKRVDSDCANGNVGTSERILSVVAGGLILGISVKTVLRKPLTGFTGVTLGSALLYRGITGRCKIKNSLNTIDDKQKEITLVEHRYFVK